MSKNNLNDFDPSRVLVSANGLNTGGVAYDKGSVVGDEVDEKLRARFWANGKCIYKDEYSPIPIAPGVKSDEKKSAPAQSAPETKPADIKKTRGKKSDS